MYDEDEAYELKLQEKWDRRKQRERCECEPIPGMTCPGKNNCPYSGYEGEEDAED